MEKVTRKKSKKSLVVAAAVSLSLAVGINAYAVEKPKTTAPGVQYITEMTHYTPNTVDKNAYGSLKVTTGAATDKVTVYKDSAKTIKVGSGLANTTIKFTKALDAAGNVYVTMTSATGTESDTVTTVAGVVADSTTPGASSITIVNPVGGTDTVSVSGLGKVTGLDSKTKYDYVTVYADAEKKTKLGGAFTTEGGIAVVSVKSKGIGAAGSVYVTVTSYGKNESAVINPTAVKETTSAAISTIQAIVVNNSSTKKIKDAVIVMDKSVTTNSSIGVSLQDGDVIDIYNDATLTEKANLLGSGSVKAGQKYVVITVKDLDAAGGKVYVKVKSKSKTAPTNYSDPTQVTYIAE